MSVRYATLLARAPTVAKATDDREASYFSEIGSFTTPAGSAMDDLVNVALASGRATATATPPGSSSMSG
jgi:hypothetical protein